MTADGGSMISGSMIGGSMNGGSMIAARLLAPSIASDGELALAGGLRYYTDHRAGVTT